MGRDWHHLCKQELSGTHPLGNDCSFCLLPPPQRSLCTLEKNSSSLTGHSHLPLPLPLSSTHTGTCIPQGTLCVMNTKRKFTSNQSSDQSIFTSKHFETLQNKQMRSCFSGTRALAQALLLAGRTLYAWLVLHWDTAGGQGSTWLFS